MSYRIILYYKILHDKILEKFIIHGIICDYGKLKNHFKILLKLVIQNFNNVYQSQKH